MTTLTQRYQRRCGPKLRAAIAFMGGLFIGTAIVAQFFAATAEAPGQWDALAYVASPLLLLLGVGIGATTHDQHINRKRPRGSSLPAGASR